MGKQLAHPNIIRILKVDTSASNPYFVMEYFPAGNLKMRIMRKEQDFLREKGLEILKQAATGLAFMNAKGWVHRDVKADNVLVASGGDVRIIDFALASIPTGMAKFFCARSNRRARAATCRRSRSVDNPWIGRSDVYSFGAHLLRNGDKSAAVLRRFSRRNCWPSISPKSPRPREFTIRKSPRSFPRWFYVC